MRFSRGASLRRLLLIIVIAAVSIIAAPAIRSTFAEEDSPALKSLREKLRETKPKLAEQFDKRLTQSRDEIKRFQSGGHLVFGRVEVEGDVDPRHVVAQMIIFEDGYFVDAIKAAEKPIGFRLTGYDTTLVIPKGAVPDEDLGTIQLKKLAKNQLSSASGQLKIEAHPKAPKIEEVTLRWDIRPDPINTPGNGFEGYSEFYQAITAKPTANGAFSVSDISPGKYNFIAQAPNCIQVHRNLALEEGKTRQMRVINLEMARKMNVEFAVSESGDFNNAEFKTTSLKADDRWRASDKTPDWGFDLLIGQQDEKLLLSYRYAPCYILDLGAKELDDDLFVDEAKLKSQQPQSVPVIEGHVYVIYQHSWNQWILMRTSEVGAIAASDDKK